MERLEFLRKLSDFQHDWYVHAHSIDCHRVQIFWYLFESISLNLSRSSRGSCAVALHSFHMGVSSLLLICAASSGLQSSRVNDNVGLDLYLATFGFIRSSLDTSWR
ncbi:hypothetical protein BDZ89DRAFT_207905 [Hymenopellis radicata]|nr:hypothetical protein BDZ89DRAFT_207905 [Hymenopellis radicata]